MSTFKIKKLLFFSTTLFFLIACNSNKNTSVDSPSLDKEKILVLLKPTVKAKALENEFKNFGLQSKGQTSRTENRFRFIYDVQKISGDELLKKIKSSNLVLEANFLQIVTKPKVTNGR